jgi:hypothetical protein
MVRPPAPPPTIIYSYVVASVPVGTAAQLTWEVALGVVEVVVGTSEVVVGASEVVVGASELVVGSAEVGPSSEALEALVAVPFVLAVGLVPPQEGLAVVPLAELVALPVAPPEAEAEAEVVVVPSAGASPSQVV